MKQAIRSYLVFTGRVYKFVVYFLVPISLIFIHTLLATRYSMDLSYFFIMLLMVVDTIGDYRLFGGILSKHSENIDCLRTSRQGISILRNALVVDLLRRCLTCCITMVAFQLVQWIVFQVDANEIFLPNLGKIILSITISFCFGVIGTMITRMVGELWMNTIAGYFLSGPAMAVFVLLSMWSHDIIANLVVFFMALILSFLSVRMVLKKMNMVTWGRDRKEEKV